MGKPAVPKGIKESVESIEDGFHVALGRLNTIRDRQNGPRDYKPIPKDQLDELEFQLNRGPSTIKELYSRAAKRHAKGKFDKGDQHAASVFRDLADTMQRDIVVPLKRAEATRERIDYGNIRIIATQIQDICTNELNQLSTRLFVAASSKGLFKTFRKGSTGSSTDSKQSTGSRSGSIPGNSTTLYAAPRSGSISTSEAQQYVYPTISRSRTASQGNGDPMSATTAQLYHTVSRSRTEEQGHGHSVSPSQIQQYSGIPWNRTTNQGFRQADSANETMRYHHIPSELRAQRSLRAAPVDKGQLATQVNELHCASEQYLGDNTNPFAAELPALEDIEREMVPKPLRPRGGSSRTIAEQQRGSLSSALTSDEESPVTPVHEMFPFPSPHSKSTKMGALGISPEIAGDAFPEDFYRRQNLSSGDMSSSGTHRVPRSDSGSSDDFTPLYMSDTLVQPEKPMLPIVPTSISHGTYGMPVLSNHLHCHVHEKSHPTTLKIEGPRSVLDRAFTFSAETKTHDLRMLKETIPKARFCKGALMLQEGDAEPAYSKRARPGALWTHQATNEYFQCEHCFFEGKSVGGKKGKNGHVDDAVYGSNGILYRWDFLFRCHVKLKREIRHPVDAPFACPFCYSEGNGIPIFKGVAPLMNHLQIHRRRCPDLMVLRKMNGIAHRSPDIDENFSIALPPLYF